MTRGWLGWVGVAALCGGATAAEAAWRAEQERSPMDGKVTLQVGTRAVRPVADRHGRAIRPQLIVRCEPGRAHLIFVADAVLATEDGRAVVRIRLDERPAVRYAGSRSTDYEAVFLVGAREWITRLRAAKRALVEFVPHATAERVAEFDVTGLAAHDALLRQHCGFVPPKAAP